MQSLPVLHTSCIYHFLFCGWFCAPHSLFFMLVPVQCRLKPLFPVSGHFCVSTATSSQRPFLLWYLSKILSACPSIHFQLLWVFFFLLSRTAFCLYTLQCSLILTFSLVIWCFSSILYVPCYVVSLQILQHFHNPLALYLLFSFTYTFHPWCSLDEMPHAWSEVFLFSYPSLAVPY